MTGESLNFLRLALAEGLGCRGAHRLLDRYQRPSAVLSASVGDLIHFGIAEPAARDLFSDRNRAAAEAAWNKCLQQEIQILTVQDPAYPTLLREIFDPPLVLFVKGVVDTLSQNSLAIVGSRRATPYGINVAERLARDLAQRGLVVCSGLARGIDSAAHRGALEAGGRTIAVLGSGLDYIYPRENKKMARQIESAGCLVTEFPLGTSPSPQNFPVRNRIISGLCLGTCLVEAAEFSGSLITARLALEQNREVFAVPGNVTSRNSFGPNLWIKQGAKLVQSWEDIVEELPRPLKERILWKTPDSPMHSQAELFTDAFSASEMSVLELLRLDEAVSVDDLIEKSKMTSAELLSVLCELEIKDQVKQLPGKHFVRKY
ncbi:MAG: DNA-processing protein DprA [Acidobacteriota bacterium]